VSSASSHAASGCLSSEFTRVSGRSPAGARASSTPPAATGFGVLADGFVDLYFRVSAIRSCRRCANARGGSSRSPVARAVAGACTRPISPRRRSRPAEHPGRTCASCATRSSVRSPLAEIGSSRAAGFHLAAASVGGGHRSAARRGCRRMARPASAPISSLDRAGWHQGRAAAGWGLAFRLGRLMRKHGQRAVARDDHGRGERWPATDRLRLVRFAPARGAAPARSRHGRTQGVASRLRHPLSHGTRRRLQRRQSEPIPTTATGRGCQRDAVTESTWISPAMRRTRLPCVRGRSGGADEAPPYSEATADQDGRPLRAFVAGGSRVQPCASCSTGLKAYRRSARSVCSPGTRPASS
jgi:hypothetical protein